MITEAEFSLARSCLVKVHHHRTRMLRSDRDNSFADWLHSEAHKLKTVAGHLFPSARQIAGDATQHTADRTRIALSHDGVVAGAVFATHHAVCRVDYAERHGPALRLYSVVTKCVTSERLALGEEFSYRSGAVRSEWRDALELVAFRVHIAQHTFPELKIIPLIVAPVRDAVCDYEGLHACLSPGAAAMDRSAITAATALLKIISVAQSCQYLHPVIEKRITEIARACNTAPSPVIGYKCKKCEFRGTSAASGFEKCWGPLATVTPHMFDLTHMWFIQDENGRPVADRLAREGRVSMWDIPEARITGEYAPRQLLQLDGTETGMEIIEPALLEKMKQVPYPRHFLDIETIRSLLPVHRGGKVNGLTLFQFSVHTQTGPDADYVHAAWLNDTRVDPNRSFLRALRNTLGDDGAVLIWTRYEEVSFNELFTELVLGFEQNEDIEWLRKLLSGGRIIDQNAWCFSHYWHPKMIGKTSIKSVLPAIWSESWPMKTTSLFADFPPDQNPYAVLTEEGSVADGCGAMVAYLDALSNDPVVARKSREELLRYCWVDTLAMVAIWEYWRWRLEQHGTDPANEENPA